MLVGLETLPRAHAARSVHEIDQRNPLLSLYLFLLLFVFSGFAASARSSTTWLSRALTLTCFLFLFVAALLLFLVPLLYNLLLPGPQVHLGEAAASCRERKSQNRVQGQWKDCLSFFSSRAH